MTAADHANTVRDPLAVLRERIEETRRRYGFPDIEDRYSGALLEAFLLRDAIALVAQAEAAAAELEGCAHVKRALIQEADACRERMEAAEADRDRLADALRHVQEKQPDTLAWLRANNIVFDGPLGTNPASWENVAFSIYTDLCETETIARAALAQTENTP